MYWSTHSLSIPEVSNCDLRFSLISTVGCCLGLCIVPGGSSPVACNKDEACSNCCTTDDTYSSGVGSIYSG